MNVGQRVTPRRHDLSGDFVGPARIVLQAVDRRRHIHSPGSGQRLARVDAFAIIVLLRRILEFRPNSLVIFI